MASYEIEIEPKVQREIGRIPPPDINRIRDRIDALADDPRPAGVEKLTDVGGYRIRQGTYRIVYTIDDGAHVVTITRVGPRGDVYRKR